MYLVNISDIRIRKDAKGWVVETKKKGLFFSKWVHIVSVAGMNDKPWYFSSYDFALDEATKLFRFSLMNGTQHLC